MKHVQVLFMPLTDLSMFNFASYASCSLMKAGVSHGQMLALLGTSMTQTITDRTRSLAAQLTKSRVSAMLLINSNAVLPDSTASMQAGYTNIECSHVGMDTHTSRR